MVPNSTAGESRPRVYRLDELEAVLKIGRTKIRQLVKDGRLKCVHIDRRVLVPVEAVEEFLERAQRTDDVDCASLCHPAS